MDTTTKAIRPIMIVQAIQNLARSRGETPPVIQPSRGDVIVNWITETPTATPSVTVSLIITEHHHDREERYAAMAQFWYRKGEDHPDSVDVYPHYTK